MTPETPTTEDLKGQQDEMLDLLYEVSQSALIWRKVTTTEEQRSVLFDIEQGAQKLIDLVGKLELT
ncbi:MAG: hypothetical protein KKD44_28985 [Proteobacteria bacterium]|nr:hypothetical protein [Pseudomonadota bacterium]HUW96775.1 hypothetical protein [Anaerolineae bacterium]